MATRTTVGQMDRKNPAARLSRDRRDRSHPRGAKLADIVTKHKVFTEHRKALKNNLGYSIRDLSE